VQEEALAQSAQEVPEEGEPAARVTDAFDEKQD
jgi:hypothetical protein